MSIEITPVDLVMIYLWRLNHDDQAAQLKIRRGEWIAMKKGTPPTPEAKAAIIKYLRDWKHFPAYCDVWEERWETTKGRQR